MVARGFSGCLEVFIVVWLAWRCGHKGLFLIIYCAVDKGWEPPPPLKNNSPSHPSGVGYGSKSAYPKIARLADLLLTILAQESIGGRDEGDYAAG